MTGGHVPERRLQLLLDQFDAAWEMLDARLSGRKPFTPVAEDRETDLTDDEYFWEPVPDCWSLRPRRAARTPDAFGAGEWVMDRVSPTPVPPPVTTIAWRIAHLLLWQKMRHDYTFGARTLDLSAMVWPGTAAEGVAELRAVARRWRSAVAEMTATDLDQIGRSTMPYGLDPQVPFDALLAWTNTEYTHHAAEIGLLRDLYRAQRRG